MVKIFVGNLEEGSDCDELQKLFEKFGQVNECDIIKNYGFVAGSENFFFMHLSYGRECCHSSGRTKIGGFFKICTRPYTLPACPGRSDGRFFGPCFVHMEMEEEAQAAIAALHGFEFYGSKMNVEMSHGKSKPRGGFSSSRGGPRGGGYRGGGPPMRGRGRGRGDYGDDRMNGYQSSRGGGYPDPYERRQYPPPYERPIYADYRPPPAERAVSYPGLGPRGGDYPPRPEYSRPYEYRRPYEYERSPTYAAERAPPDPYARSAEPVYRERSPVGRAAAADPYARPSPEYYQQRSRYSESNMYPPTADRYSDPYPPPGTSPPREGSW